MVLLVLLPLSLVAFSEYAISSSPQKRALQRWHSINHCDIKLSSHSTGRKQINKWIILSCWAMIHLDLRFCANHTSVSSGKLPSTFSSPSILWQTFWFICMTCLQRPISTYCSGKGNEGFTFTSYNVLKRKNSLSVVKQYC